MHIEFLVEEPSAEAAIHNLVHKIMGQEISYRIHVFQGKQDLLKQLPKRLKGYRSWFPNDWKIVVLIDKDRQDCFNLKAKMEEIAQEGGLITKSKAGQERNYQVVNRMAIDELEAWFFGDVRAVKMAYSKISKGLDRKSNYRDPDAIEKASKSLERILQRSGYYRGGLPKVEVARKISTYMDPMHNSSKSFQVFRDALREMIS